MDKYIGPITETFIDKITKELKKSKTKEKIMKGIIDPLLKDLSVRYYPHFITMTTTLIIIIVLLISILILLVIQHCSLNK